MKLKDIYIRDPYILPYDGKYYMYRSEFPSFVVHVSEDLVNWSEPKPVFTRPEGFWADSCFWAPECHEYKGNFYLFVSLKSDNRCRGTQIFKCDRPDGTFEPISEYPQTPEDWECLDGTLYVEDGKPYMVFSHEETQIIDGAMAYIPLSDDLSRAIGEPKVMFNATSAPFVVAIPLRNNNCYVMDGPWMHKTKDGDLFTLWASFSKDGYVETYAKSSNGRLDGEWIQCEPLFTGDGGHAMMFKSFEGKLYLVLHCPSGGGLERATLIEIEEKDGKLVPKK